MITVLNYVTSEGKNVFAEWLSALNDSTAYARVITRIDRLKAGNFGDCRTLRDGVSELRIDYGPGYRVYYGQVGKRVILLLCAGDKRKQGPDIVRAVGYLIDYRRRLR